MDEKAPVFLFDDVRVEPAAFRVWKAGAAVAVEPKALEVLLFLIQNRGRVVQKRELLDTIWHDTFVGENALTREIAQLRKALGEDARRARYIETVPTRGYRFIAEVEESVSVSNGAGATTSNGASTNGATTNGSFTAVRTSFSTSSTDAPAVEVGRVRSRRAFLLLSGAALVLLLCVGGLVWWGFTRGRAETTVQVRRLTQVTTSTGLDIYPAISPDGGYVAYSSNSGGDFEIYVRQLAPGGREIRITDDGGRNFQPAWSPDGQFIAYYSQRRGGLWLVPALGGVARRLTNFGSKPAWSPDGEQIAFQSGGLHDLVGVQGGALPPSTIWAVNARGGEPMQLTKTGVPSGGHGSPVWWPGGKRILFFAFDLMMNEVWSVSVETGEVRRHGPGVQPFSDIIFSPDGRYAYCAGAYRGASFGLFRIPINLDAGETAGDVEKVEGTAGTPIRYLSISADGRRIAYSTQSLVSDIWQLPLTSAGNASGTPAPLYEDTSRRKTNPAISPDGKWIAFGVWRLGTPSSVWLVDSEGKNPSPLTTDEGGSGVPNWLPGGDRIAYLTQRDRRMMFYTKSWATGDEKPLMELPPLANTPHLSPDGRLVAYNSREGGVINVWVQAVEGGTPRRLTSDAEMAGFPAWSPDGKWLALEVRRGDDMQVAVMPSEGGEPVLLTHEPGLSWPHSFSPDSEFIAFAGYRDGLWNLYRVSRRTGEQQQLTHFNKTNGYVRYPAWSPTGDRIVFEHAEATGNVWLVELK
ncbi:MAG TPA: winged helix-turn-helix domain-containing protein [Pyrinomonadaceae bacterium]|nr:winged helix-turn-helix domain-containing protein [Pyrinomonadaceae bacterium]